MPRYKFNLVTKGQQLEPPEVITVIDFVGDVKNSTQVSFDVCDEQLKENIKTVVNSLNGYCSLCGLTSEVVDHFNKVKFYIPEYQKDAFFIPKEETEKKKMSKIQLCFRRS